MEHFPPLDSSTPTNETPLAVKPKIISRGGLTLATPVSEIRFFRRTSDLIANKYTPQAASLNIRSVGDLSRIGNFIKTRIWFTSVESWF